ESSMFASPGVALLRCAPRSQAVTRMVSAKVLEADIRKTSAAHLEAVFRIAGLGLKANETRRMLIGGNRDQERSGHCHAGYEVDALDLRFGHEVRPGGHEEPQRASG